MARRMAMRTFDISLCMIVRDEEKTLSRCLSSVKDTVAEIIVVDTGSTDRSVEIAETFGARVINVPWKHHFAEARNAALERATGQWILVLDADEEWAPPAPDYLRQLLGNEQRSGYDVKLVSYVGETGQESVTDSVCRLFRNDPRIRFSGSIHEGVTDSILAISPSGIESSSLVIRHYGYLDAVIREKNKNERNLAIILEALKARQDDLQLLYALGTEHFQQKDYDKALAVFESILPRTSVYAGFASDILLKTAYACKETGNRQRALSLAEEGLRYFPDFTDLLEFMAIMHSDSGAYEAALELLKRAISIGDVSHKYTSSSGSGTYRSCFMAGTLHERLFMWEEAFELYGKALQYHPNYSPAWQQLTFTACLSGRSHRLNSFISEQLLLLSGETKSFLLQLHLDRLNNQAPPLPYSDLLLAGVLSTECGQYKESARWFMKAADQYEGKRLITYTGLIHSFIEAARRYSVVELDPPESVWNCLLMED
ncbi:glycosyltransferase [Paenibacillus sp. LHD-117]|uniref:tetratricopeptide repeat-containing glycosyltransferase family 2 protein n=1 Tax=Paenibacillus sp. LHD-117 TaxID=3071412 RepID=UPI0027E05800|nr:glycosyltransferase [Paenibacillus sp. LHD-117]MDQ6422464.1 glycosyltransferase [Paenibacillus sp. LHD-117]